MWTKDALNNRKHRYISQEGGMGTQETSIDVIVMRDAYWHHVQCTYLLGTDTSKRPPVTITISKGLRRAYVLRLIVSDTLFLGRWVDC